MSLIRYKLYQSRYYTLLYYFLNVEQVFYYKVLYPSLTISYTWGKSKRKTQRHLLSTNTFIYLKNTTIDITVMIAFITKDIKMI